MDTIFPIMDTIFVRPIKLPYSSEKNISGYHYMYLSQLLAVSTVATTTVGIVSEERPANGILTLVLVVVRLLPLAVVLTLYIIVQY